MNIEQRIEFAEAHVGTADGGPFQIAGREWVRDEFWLPLVGYKLWPVDRSRVCTPCRRRTGEIVESVYDVDETRTDHHASMRADCQGLHAHVIWLILEQLPRQSGKTAGVTAFAATEIANHIRISIAFIAGSEDQSEVLFRENFNPCRERSALMKRRLRSMRTRMICDRTKSQFAIFPTSLAGATGGARNYVIIDEARDVHPKVFTAFVPQINARNGWRCPTGAKGHAHSNGDLQLLDAGAVDPTDPKYGTRCTACDERLQPWVGRVCAMSSAQELDGSERDWFHNLCDAAESEPTPDTHVHRATEVINPAVSEVIVSRSREVLGKIEGLSEYVEIEAGNQSRQKGEAFLAPSDILACENRSLHNADSGVRQAVGFLDTSQTNELTSLVLFEDSSDDAEEQWHRIQQVRLDAWDPKALPGGIINEHVIEEHLRWVCSRFAIVRLRLDERARPWAIRMLKRLQSRESPYRGIIHGAQKWGRAERRIAWTKLEERYLSRRIETFADKRLRAELKGARRYHDIDDQVDVREPRRRVRHLDIAEGVASVCLDVHYLSMSPARRGLAETDDRVAHRGSVVKLLKRARATAGIRGDNWD